MHVAAVIDNTIARFRNRFTFFRKRIGFQKRIYRDRINSGRPAPCRGRREYRAHSPAAQSG